jgi:Transposase domain (DUF772)
LKALYDESDETVVSKWVENPYWQYFCGEESFQHELPCHPTSLVKWRQRVGPEGVEKLLKQVLRAATQQQALNSKEIKTVNVDTTVQEKAIAFPTDARLYDKARRALVRLARTYQVKLRQSYVRLGKRALFQQSRHAAARQGQRAQKETRKLKTYLGRVIPSISSGTTATWCPAGVAENANSSRCLTPFGFSWSVLSGFIISNPSTSVRLSSRRSLRDHAISLENSTVCILRKWSVLPKAKSTSPMNSAVKSWWSPPIKFFCSAPLLKLQPQA